MVSDSGVITVWQRVEHHVLSCVPVSRGAKDSFPWITKPAPVVRYYWRGDRGWDWRGWFVFRGIRGIIFSSKLATSAWNQILMRLLVLYIIYSALLFQGQMSKHFVVGFFCRETALAYRIISVKLRMEIVAGKVRRRAASKISNLSNNKTKCPGEFFYFFLSLVPFANS